MNQNTITFRNHEFGYEFDLSIIGYEFPENVTDSDSDSDSNWLVVGVECRYQGEKFKTTDPSIETIELEDIKKWFQAISRNTIPNFTQLSFTEPNLEFHLYGNYNGTIRFGVKLDAECKPPFHIPELTAGTGKLDDNFVMVFENSLQEMEEFSRGFRSLVALFPSRGGM